jgi:hypothetical protein
MLVQDFERLQTHFEDFLVARSFFFLLIFLRQLRTGTKPQILSALIRTLASIDMEALFEEPKPVI